MKTCYTCNVSKPVGEFNADNNRLDKKSRYCKECQRNRGKLHYYKNHSDRKKSAYECKIKHVQELRDWIENVVKKSGCCICSEKTPVCLEFHHLDPSKKSGWVHKLISDNSRSKLFVELAKCTVVCSNCHRKIHAGLVTNPTEHRLKNVVFTKT